MTKNALPGFTGEASLNKVKAEYTSYSMHSYQSSETISPAFFNIGCWECLIGCEFMCNPLLGGAKCLVSCPQICSRKCDGGDLYTMARVGGPHEPSPINPRF